MDSLKQLLSSALEELENIRTILNSLKNPDTFMHLKTSFYRLSLKKEQIQIQVYQTKKESAIVLVQSSFFQALKQYFDKNLRDLNELDDELFIIMKEELQPLLRDFEESSKQLLQLFKEAKLNIVYEQEYKDFIDNKKNPRELIKKVERNIINYLESGNPIRANTLTITDRADPRLLHAHIPAPMDDYRILYFYNEKERIIRFLKVARGKELGFANH